MGDNPPMARHGDDVSLFNMTENFGKVPIGLRG